MTDFRGNIDHWFRQSEPDYYLFFLKAWIPFNAWYVSELPLLNKNDALIIKELQDHPNSKPRSIIEAYLENETRYDAKNFRSHLAELHHFLEAKSLKHNGRKLSFTSIFQNSIKFDKDIDATGNIYKAEFKTSYYQALIVDKGSRSLLDFKQPKYCLDDLKKHNDFLKIRDKKVQKRMIKCYETINPDKTFSLVSSSKIKSEYITLKSENTINFITDTKTVARSCIKVLYALRCMLFHGEVEPTNVNKPVYEHAYFLLRLILKELI